MQVEENRTNSLQHEGCAGRIRRSVAREDQVTRQLDLPCHLRRTAI